MNVQQHQPQDTIVFIVQAVRRATGIDLRNHLQTLEEILDLLHDLFELFQILKDQVRRYSQQYRQRVLEIWARQGPIIALVFNINVDDYINFQNIFDPEVKTLVLGVLVSAVGGIPIAITLILIYLFVHQISVIYFNRSMINETLTQFSVFEEKIIRLHNMTAQLEDLITQYLSNENSNSEQFKLIETQFEVVRSFNEREFIQQLDSFRLDLQDQLRKSIQTQTNLRQTVLSSVVYGAGTALMAGASVIAPPVAIASIAFSTLYGGTAAYFDRRASNDIQQIYETLEQLSFYEQLAKEMLQKIKKLEKFNTEPPIIKYCFATAVGFSFVALMINNFL